MKDAKIVRTAFVDKDYESMDKKLIQLLEEGYNIISAVPVKQYSINGKVVKYTYIEYVLLREY